MNDETIQHRAYNTTLTLKIKKRPRKKPWS